MTEAICGTCPFWVELPGRPEGKDHGGYGNCHHVIAAAEEEPSRYGNWWCSEHPLHQRDRLAAMALTAVIREMWGEPEGSRAVAECAYQIADAMLVEAAKGRAS